MVKGHYTIVPNELWLRQDISSEAKLIWCYLMSMPENWDSSRNNIARNLKFDKNTVSKCIKQLESKNILRTIPASRGAFDFELLPTEVWQPERLAEEISWMNKSASTGLSGQPDLDEAVSHNKEYNNINNNIAHPAVGQADQATAVKYDLEAIYSKYPKKVGKARGMKKLAKLVTSKQRYDDLMAAVVNYDRHCKAEKRNKQYIKQFDTFLNDHWQDWVQPEKPASERYDSWD